jgi:hypothetical protein
MRISTLFTAVIAGTLVYAFASPRGRRLRHRVLDDRLESVAWLHRYGPGVSGVLDTFDERLDALGGELKSRLDTLAQPGPNLYADDWTIDQDDLDRDLRGVQRYR